MTDDDRESIYSLDNIRLDLPVAGAGSRVAAGLLDILIVGVLLFLWALLCITLALWAKGSWGVAAGLCGVFLIEWSYFSGMEIGMGGRTPGKAALGLRVVTAEGAKPGNGALLARNLVRDFDFFVAVPLMVFDPLARRLGDRLAGTIVVHDRGRETMPALGRVPPGWGAREVAIVEAYLARAGGLTDAAARDGMARQLLARVARDAPDFVAGAEGIAGDPVEALRHALAVEAR